MVKKLVSLGFLDLFLLGFVLLLPQVAHAASATVPLKVTVENTSVGKLNAVEIQAANLSGGVLGTCQTASSKITCDIQVATGAGILVVPQPTSGEAWKSFKGSNCQSAPGPICHIQIYTKGKAVTIKFGTKPSGPSMTTINQKALGHSPTMSFGDNHVQANGIGFTPNSPATLTDDGAVVATGATDANGNVSLGYDALSEPGVYRKLTMSVSGQTANTDVYNAFVYTWGEGDQGTGAVKFEINETDVDANTMESYVQFNNNTPVQVPFEGTAGQTQGYTHVLTPSYICPAGTPGILKIYGKRGVGTPEQYHYLFTIPITC